MKQLNQKKNSERTKYRPYWLTSSYYRKLRKNKNNNNEDIRENTHADNIMTNYASVSVSDQLVNSTKPSTSNDEEFDSIPEQDDIDVNQEQLINDKLSLLNELSDWAIAHRLTLASVTNLLKILRSHGMTELPKDARTLLKTPLATDIIEMGTGKFWYNGIKSNLLSTLSICDISQSLTISLLFNIDGMSPFNSSQHQFWPISFIIKNMPHIQPIVAAIYYGDSKPPLQLFFKQFVEELKEICREGLQIGRHEVNVKIECFVCDTQARSFIKGTPGSNAEYGSCIKCTVVGDWDKKGRHMSYPKIDCPRRTNESFRNKIDEDHHREDTPLTELDINMVEDFVIADSLHLFDLGLTRRCLYGWREGSYNFRTKWSKAQADSISEMLQTCNATKPSDIHREIRTLKFLKFWKGSEYRTFGLYLGPVILKDFLPSDVYEHFLTLNAALTILSCDYYSQYLDIAERLLNDYIETFIDIYGIDSISSNVHNLCHVVDDVRKFGPLPGISSYPFESYLGHLKSLIRSGNLPLSQISRRVMELSKLNNLKLEDDSGIFLKNKIIHKNHEVSMCSGVYKTLHLSKNFILSNDDKNKYFMTKNNDIVSMINATLFKKKIHIFGACLQNIYDFFVKPFASSRLNIYASKEKQINIMNGNKYICDLEAPKLYSLNDIKCKLFCIQYHSEFVFFSLIHTVDIKITCNNK